MINLNNGHSQTQVLRELGVWIHGQFAAKQPPQHVEVVLFTRKGAFTGWHEGEVL